MAKLSHIVAIEKEFKEIEENKAWNQVYQKVRTEGTYDLICAAARSPFNKNLNRYRDVLPYDHSRIVLQGCNTDYINASLVEVESVGRKYILSQGPLSHTTPHFWLLVWQQKCKGIVMLNKIMEKNQLKCHQYWPIGEKKGGEMVTEYPSVNLKVELLKETSHSRYIYRTFRLTNTSTNENREVLHFHYTTWPDFGVPQSPEAFFKFLSVVRASQCLESHFGPAVIHCSAGIGRSGTFCLVDTLLLMLSKGLCTAEPGKVLEVLLDMRKYRMGLIQTHEQLRFSYQAIIYGAHRLNETNGKDPSEESSSEDVSQEEAPPLPPVRTDSLTRSMLENEFKEKLDNELQHLINDDDTADTDDDDDDDDKNYELDDDLVLLERDSLGRDYQRQDTEKLNDALGRPLPIEPSDGTSSIQSSPPSTPTTPTTPDNLPNSCQNDVRRRRLDRVASTVAKVQAIKDKTKAAEQWEERKRETVEEDEVPAKRPRI